MAKGQPEVIEGRLIGTGLRFGIIVSRFNDFITKPLLDGALETLKRHGVELSDVDVMWCPGAFEIPCVAKQAASTERYDALICLGAVIRGATAHFDFVCQGATQGIQEVSLHFNKPVMFCVLTDDNIKQSRERSGGKHGNKGTEAAVGALKMLGLKDKLQK